MSKPLSLGILTLLLTACSQPSTPITLIQARIRLARGTSLEQTEHVASARLFEAFKSKPDVKAVQTVSTPESCEIYVQIQSSDALHEVASILQSTLPPTALVADIYSRGGNIPVITPASAPTAKIEIDWQKAIVFGVDQSQIDSAVATLGTRPSTQQLLALIIAVRNGQPIRLSDVARLAQTLDADCIVHRWP